MKWIFDLLDAIPALWRLVEIKTEAMFLRQLRTYCLKLFRGELGEFEWIDDMSTTIADQIGKAWREGAAAVDVSPADFTDEDIEELNKIIASEYNYVLALGSDILALRLMGGMLEEYRTKFAGRIEVWAHRYTDVVNQAKVWFGKRKKVKLKWEMGATEEHCATCAALDGIVAYAEDWERSGIHPQNPPNRALECGGWRCDCSLVPTTERATNNAFDEIVDRVTAAKAGEKSLKYDPNQPRVPAGNSDGGQWISQAGYSRIRDIENKIKNKEREHGYAFDSDGNFVVYAVGEQDKVVFPKEKIILAKGGYLTHNHPNNTTFSPRYFAQASALDLKETRVVTSEITFVAKPSARGWWSPETMKSNIDTARQDAMSEPGFFELSQIEQSRRVNKRIMDYTRVVIEEIEND
jgi:hypothetical protein